MNLLDRTASLLLIIDLQPDFYPSNRRDVDRSALGRVNDTVAWLAGVAEANDVPVVVTEEDPERNGATHPDIIAALPPSTPIYSKTVFGAGGEAEIMKAIDGLDLSTIIIVGCETDICVTHTAFGLQTSGYRVAVISDAVYSPGTAQQDGFRRLHDAGIELLSAKQLLYEWLPTLGEIRRFRTDHPSHSEPRHFNL